MNRTTISVSDFEDALKMWSWGKWARSCWFKTKYPEWVKRMTGIRKDTEQEVKGRYIPPIDDAYGEKLDAAISRLPELTRDVLVHIYVNRLEVSDVAKDLETSQYVVRDERKMGLSMLYGRMVNFDLNTL
jgi:hypothetical protein